MTIAHDMDIVDDDCVRNVSTAAEAGVWLQEMQGKAFMLVKGRIPERPTKTGPFQEATLQPEVPEGGRVRSSWESYTSVDAKGAADGGIRDRSGTLDSFATTYTSAAPSDRSTPEA